MFPKAQAEQQLSAPGCYFRGNDATEPLIAPLGQRFSNEVCCRAAPRSDGADMTLRRDVRQRIVAGDVEAAQQLLQQRRPQLLAIPSAQRPDPKFAGAGFGASSPALVADPADGVLLGDEEASGREDDMEDGETGRHGGACVTPLFGETPTSH